MLFHMFLDRLDRLCLEIALLAVQADVGVGVLRPLMVEQPIRAANADIFAKVAR